MKCIDIQGSKFTHGKCLNCGYLSSVSNFQEVRRNEQNIDNENGSVEFYQTILICPMCGDDGCEGVFPNEVN